jgi:hypothetical protein
LIILSFPQIGQSGYNIYHLLVLVPSAVLRIKSIYNRSIAMFRRAPPPKSPRSHILEIKDACDKAATRKPETPPQQRRPRSGLLFLSKGCHWELSSVPGPSKASNATQRLRPAICGADDKHTAELQPILHDRVEWTGRSAASHQVHATKPLGVEVRILDKEDSGPRVRQYGIPLTPRKNLRLEQVLSANQIFDPDLLEIMKRSQVEEDEKKREAEGWTGNVKRNVPGTHTEGQVEEDEKKREVAGWTGHCCNALYLVHTQKEEDSVEQLLQQHQSCQREIQEVETDIRILDLRQRLLWSEGEQDTKLSVAQKEQLVSQLANSKLLLSHCASKTADAAIRHARDGPSTSGRFHMGNLRGKVSVQVQLSKFLFRGFLAVTMPGH